MSYKKTLQYLFSALPMYQRVGPPAYKADLTNTLKIVEILQHPQKKIKCIHVAGTNGKGSSSHMIAAVLQKAGYKTGLYTSPHLLDFRERIKINGKMIGKDEVVDFVEKYKHGFEHIEPSFFEWSVGLAFYFFAKEEVDVAVIEVGLGGRLDSTNIITPLVSLITNIGLDHTNLLGGTLDKIATEKAGIIKHKVPVVISQTQADINSLFGAVAREKKAEILFADKKFKVLSYNIEKDLLKVSVQNKSNNQTSEYELDLTGNYQLKNLPGVLAVIDIIEKLGFIFQEKDIKDGLKNVCKLTGLKGRWQQLSKKPLIIADTAHNEDGIKQVAEHLKNLSFEKLHIIFGVVNDKDLSGILSALPKNASYYFVKANVPRALNENELLKSAKNYRLSGKAFDNVAEGLKAAKKSASKNDVIFIGGSTFVVADALEVYED
jgi:dihydrofolate synthase / folylpolyglutamate synthase